MKEKEQQITIWVTQPALPENAAFTRWGIWLHHPGETLIQMAKVVVEHDTNLPDLNPCLYHVRFSRWVLENISIVEQGVQDGDIFVLVTQEKEKEHVAAYMKANKQFPENIPPDVALHRNFITMQDVDDWLRDKLVVTSPWASGSFYLATFLVVIIGLGVLASSVPFYVLVIVLISAILFVPLIGALQLKQDKRLSEKGFMELIGMVVGQLPLIGKIARSFGPRTNYSFFF